MRGDEEVQWVWLVVGAIILIGVLYFMFGFEVPMLTNFSLLVIDFARSLVYGTGASVLEEFR